MEKVLERFKKLNCIPSITPIIKDKFHTFNNTNYKRGHSQLESIPIK